MEGNKNQRVREYIDRLFVDAPKTRAALELKEELISNAEEKYADMVAQGYQEEDSFEVVIHSIGNIDELFRELEHTDEETALYQGLTRKEQKKKALLTAAAIGLYIFAGAFFFGFALLDELWGTEHMSLVGLILTVLICIAPTVMLVYSSMMQPKYQKKEDNMVEEYKEWKSGSSRDKELRKAISSIIWTLGVVFYFVWSAFTNAWNITWVTFLVLACIDSIVGLMFSFRRDKR